MKRILVSACLLDHPVRYNGVSVACRHPILERWLAENRVIPICPETAGGLPNRRPPAEIAGGQGGTSVLAGIAMVVDPEGNDLTAHFVAGAKNAVRLAGEHEIRIALMKERSPSCGVNYTYDGTFSGHRISAAGVTSESLRLAGVQIFSELQIEAADELLTRLEFEETDQNRSQPLG